MELEFRPDFEQVADRWQAMWLGHLDRPLVFTVVPKPGLPPVPKPHSYLAREIGYEAVAQKVLEWAESNLFLGDAIPFCSIELAADHLAGLLGGHLEFGTGHGGGWAVATVGSLTDFEISFDQNGPWWQRTVEYATALRKHLDGKVLICAPTLAANLDTLSALRGPENLIFDLMDDPESVHKALEQVTQAYGQVVEALKELLDYRHLGSINRHGLYSRGTISVPQCDFSCMISPEMFNEFALPHLKREMQALDAVEYHLDGPGAIKHLESLCSLSELDVIQWVPGAGASANEDWTDLRLKIDALGKGQLLGGSFDEYRALVPQLRSRKLIYYPSCKQEKEVRQFLDSL